MIFPGFSAPASAAPPKDARAWLLGAKRTSGLVGDNTPPWTLKASFRLYDEQGNLRDQGTFEELWVSSSQWKRVYGSSLFTQTLYGTGRGIFQTGEPESPPWPLAKLHEILADPIQESEFSEEEDLAVSSRKTLGTKTVCIAATPKPHGFNAAIIPDFESCFDERDGTLREQTENSGIANVALRTGHLNFAGSRLATGIDVFKLGKLVLAVHLESVKPLSDPNDPALQLPTEAKPAAASQAGTPAVSPSPSVEMDAKESERHLIRETKPEYPAIAKAAHVQGTVVLQALIGKKGEVLELSVESGPPMLQQAALDAVHQWIYKPFSVNGKPVQVFTKVHVVFQLAEPARAK